MTLWGTDACLCHFRVESESTATALALTDHICDSLVPPTHPAAEAGVRWGKWPFTWLFSFFYHRKVSKTPRRLNEGYSPSETSHRAGGVHPVSAADEHLFGISGSAVCGPVRTAQVLTDNVKSSGAACFCSETGKRNKNKFPVRNLCNPRQVNVCFAVFHLFHSTLKFSLHSTMYLPNCKQRVQNCYQIKSQCKRCQFARNGQVLS